MTPMAIKTLVFLALCLVFALCLFLAAWSKRPFLALMFSILTAVTAITTIVLAFSI